MASRRRSQRHRPWGRAKAGPPAAGPNAGVEGIERPAGRPRRAALEGVYTLVVYDIPSTRTRVRVASACLDYGLDRIQKSAFLGVLGRSRREELTMRLTGALGDDPGRVQVFPIREEEVKRSWHLLRD